MKPPKEAQYDDFVTAAMAQPELARLFEDHFLKLVLGGAPEKAVKLAPDKAAFFKLLDDLEENQMASDFNE